jgi:hypothetical protein
MWRYLWLLLLPALLLTGTAPATAQWPQPRPAPVWRAAPASRLDGAYLHQNGGPCSVERRRDGYLFINEQGSWARFVFTGPNRLEQVGVTEWDPSTVCTVSRDRFGRTVLRFDSSDGPPGYWRSAD